MLGSITPLGERGRGSRWSLTVAAYVAGSVIAATAFGAALGAIGSLWPGVPANGRLVLLGSVVSVGLALDLHFLGTRLPTVRRQVDERWRTSYRGWVWGLGYGGQLGVGVVTIVTTSTVYAVWAAAMLSGRAVAGVTIGATFGVARALPVFSVAGVHRPDQLLRVDATLSRLASPAGAATYLAAAMLAVTSLVGAARW